MTNLVLIRQQEECFLQGVHSVIAVFDTLDRAERAVQLLDQGGFPCVSSLSSPARSRVNTRCRGTSPPVT